MNVLSLCDEFVTAVMEKAPFSKIKSCIEIIKNNWSNISGDYFIAEEILIGTAFLSENMDIINELYNHDSFSPSYTVLSDYSELQTRIMGLLVKKKDSPLLPILINEYMKDNNTSEINHNSNFLLCYYLMKIKDYENLKRAINDPYGHCRDEIFFLALINKDFTAADITMKTDRLLDIEKIVTLVMDHSESLENDILPYFNYKLNLQDGITLDNCTDINELLNAIIGNNTAQSKFFSALFKHYTSEEIRRSKHISSLKITDLLYPVFCDIVCSGNLNFLAERLDSELNLHLDRHSGLSIYNMLKIYNSEIKDRIVFCVDNKSFSYILDPDEISFLIAHFRMRTSSPAGSNNELLKTILRYEDPDLIKLSFKKGVINSANFEAAVQYAVENNMYKTLNILYEQ